MFQLRNIMKCTFFRGATLLCWLTVHATVKGSGDCTCEDYVVVCTKIDDMDELKSHPALMECRASQLRIKKCTLPALPENLLLGSLFTSLRIQDTDIYFISPPFGPGSAFRGAQFVLELTLDNVNYPYNWNWTHLNYMEKLKRLRIMNSDFLYISPSFATIKLPTLEILVIQNSGVKWIHDKAFASFSDITHIYLTQNQIKEFRRSFLPSPAKRLYVISLKDNNLERVDSDLFSAMPSLKYISLENNNLLTLSEDVIPFQQRNLFIELTKNPLRCDCSILWILKKPRNFNVNRIRCYEPSSSDSISLRKLRWKMLNCGDMILPEDEDEVYTNDSIPETYSTWSFYDDETFDDSA